MRIVCRYGYYSLLSSHIIVFLTQGSKNYEDRMAEPLKKRDTISKGKSNCDEPIGDEPMIDMKQAVQIALEFCRNLYGQEKLAGLLLEEVELSDDEKFWLVTIGFNLGQGETSQSSTNLSGDSLTRRSDHVFKTMKVDASSGRALSLKIKKL